MLGRKRTLITLRSTMSSRKTTKKIGMLDDIGVKVDLRNNLNEKLIAQMYLCAED